MSSSYHPEDSAHGLKLLRDAQDSGDAAMRLQVLEKWLEFMGAPDGDAEHALYNELLDYEGMPDRPVIFDRLERLIHDADLMWSGSVSSRLERQDVVLERQDAALAHGRAKRSEGRRKGGQRSAASRSDEADRIKAWLYPMLAKADAFLVEEGKKQRGAQTLVDQVVNYEMFPNDDRQKYVTHSRVTDWIKAGRPRTHE